MLDYRLSIIYSFKGNDPKRTERTEREENRMTAFFKFWDKGRGVARIVSVDYLDQIVFIDSEGLVRINLNGGEEIVGYVIAKNGSVVKNAQKILDMVRGTK
jgi:hypothetical protein